MKNEFNSSTNFDRKKNIAIFDLSFECCNLVDAVHLVLSCAREGKKGLVVTPNVDHIVMIQDDIRMLKIFQGALFRFADGMPLVWFSKIAFGKRALPSRVTGADLFIETCGASGKLGLRVFFLGGNEGVVEKAASALVFSYPDLVISGTYCPPHGFEGDLIETRKIVNLINDSQTDILFIGVGTPKQEKWAYENISFLNVGPILCVGAAFDFAAGIQKRAPKFLQRAGLEWAWRLASEPARLWRRYLLRDSRFFGLAVREFRKLKFGSHDN